MYRMHLVRSLPNRLCERGAILMDHLLSCPTLPHSLSMRCLYRVPPKIHIRRMRSVSRPSAEVLKYLNFQVMARPTSALQNFCPETTSPTTPSAPSTRSANKPMLPPIHSTPATSPRPPASIHSTQSSTPFCQQTNIIPDTPPAPCTT